MKTSNIKVKPGKPDNTVMDIMVFAFGLIFVIFMGLHAATVQGLRDDHNWMIAMVTSLSHMADPFNFDINEYTLKTILMYILVYGIIMFMVKIDIERHQRDPKAKGTAEWTTNMKKYNAQFVDQKNEFNNSLINNI